MRFAVLFCALLCFGSAALPQSNSVENAVEALQRGDLSAAEAGLRAALRTEPRNADALAVLAVVLDREKKYAEADEIYRRALAQAPRSGPLLNNYGNHLVATGKLDLAHDVFLKAIAINPAQMNARVQLARIALQRKNPTEALHHLDALPISAQAGTEVEIARMQALFDLHRSREADAILVRLTDGAGRDANANYSLGVALSAAGQYEKAEQALSRALEADPQNFDVAYSLGLAAAHAGHAERARDILQSALRRQPENVDVLYDLAAVSAKLGQSETALQLLAQANRLAPDRADVQQLLARTAADVGYFGDAIEAWDRYLKLVPGDEVARRERAFTASAIGQDPDRALNDLKAYTARHPADPIGHYELGVAEASASPQDALSQLNRALTLRPELAAAHIARGLLHFKQANFAAALPDFQEAAKQEPNNPVVLDRLGQCYMALDRLRDAVPVLRRAAELAPRDSQTLIHLGRALTNAGEADEARKVFARFRELGPNKSSLPHPAGLVDFLSLSSADQLARYRAGVERTVQANPGNAEAQVRYLKLLLDEGKPDEALNVARRILALAPSNALLVDAGNALLAAFQWTMARQLLEKPAADEHSATTMINLAIATSHAVSPRAGLEQLDQIPQAQRSGDYYLARAQMVDAAGNAEEASESLNQALRANPTRADLYPYALSFLMGKGRTAEAVALMDRAAHAASDNPDILLMRAVTLEATGRARDTEQALKSIESRWPDWYNVWLARAILAAWDGQADEARQLLQTAAALGAANADQKFGGAIAPAGGTRNGTERGLRLLRALFP